MCNELLLYLVWEVKLIYLFRFGWNTEDVAGLSVGLWNTHCENDLKTCTYETNVAWLGKICKKTKKNNFVVTLFLEFNKSMLFC